jgi:hypothetical protein
MTAVLVRDLRVGDRLISGATVQALYPLGSTVCVHFLTVEQRRRRVWVPGDTEWLVDDDEA